MLVKHLRIGCRRVVQVDDVRTLYPTHLSTPSPCWRLDSRLTACPETGRNLSWERYMPNKRTVTSRRVYHLLPLCIALACSDGAGPESANLPACTGDISLTVSSGPTPRFSWSPGCKTFFLLVESQGAGGDVWSIMTPGTNGLVSGIRYGTVPDGAQELDPASPLVAGSPYAVYVFRYTGPDSDDGVLIGAQTFTP